ncbi:hypothetical protein H0H93_007056 [Arthromyces matolae]|nr:hypothetical protein H0H93_007056 [Arthromyces matolae]
MAKKARPSSIDAFILFIQSDARSLQYIAENDDKKFMARLARGLSSSRELAPRGPPNMRTFLSWCSSREIPLTVAAAIEHRKHKLAEAKFAKRDFLRNSALSWTRKQTDIFMDSIPKIDVELPQTPYPEFNCAIAETESTFNLWSKTLLKDKQPDARRKRSTIAVLDQINLVYDLGPNDSAVFRDARSGETVMVVIRHVCGNTDLLTWMDTTITDACAERNSIRKEDSGTLAQMGYSAGARDKERFNWVLNLRSTTPQSRSQAAISDLNSSVAFALFWRLAQKHLLREIIDDFAQYMSSIAIKRMDANGQLSVKTRNGVHPNPTPSNSTNPEPAKLAEEFYIKPGKNCPRPNIIEHRRNEVAGTYSISIKDHVFTFRDAELAPPTGVMGENYSRAMHDETQPHKWAVSWTVSRGNLKDAGCNFYLARYGIRVQMSSDTMIAWRPTDLHGTSLPHADPKDKNPEFKQRGMAFVTSSRLSRVWNKYLANK